MEKQGLPLLEEQQRPRLTQKTWIVKRTFSVLVLGILTIFLAKPLIHDLRDRFEPHHKGPNHHGKHHHKDFTSLCQQPQPLYPPQHERLDQAYDFLSTSEFKNASIKRHSGAVQIPTQSFDDLGPVGEDKRWEALYPFTDYLAATFPRIHKELKLEKVNTHGKVYTWEGSDSSLKPLILMAHQDVVPVPDSTVDAWTHPPFSGFFDGKFIWGRGSSDCKNQLIAELETIETLLEYGFEPKRTIILAFGFDEEISGRQGAGRIAAFLIERYGKDSIAAIVDEGAGLSNNWGLTFATPGVGEKGYTDVSIIIRKPGGHSSIPTDHTSIGIASEIITAIESEQYPTYLADDSPFLGLLQCAAAHAEEFPNKLKKLLGARESRANVCKAKPDYLALEAAKLGKMVQYLMQTSQAVDVISGGVKVNALPERTEVTVNHRLNIGDTPEVVWKRLTKIVKPVAEKYNLSFHGFDGTKEEKESISLSASDTTLEVAPVTPTEVGEKDTPYSILAGTTRALYGEDIIVSPGMMTGNTDTRYYWPITKHIFRYGPGYDPTWDKGLGNVHTVDEKISVVNHLNMVKWFMLFVRNVDGARFEDE
ncbi:Peptidase dimerization domain [Teratosphaeria destructans]|uniref:Peptidase dimerization domain n=1 Tax=Teratosphaeria destructans TaxID=418781 RepID=A0A9W7SJA7_9PEZI|nr:Peptidase dimerization domain [Teratosphaeria destructans]